MEIKHFKLLHSKAPRLTKEQIDKVNKAKLDLLYEHIKLNGEDRNDLEAQILYDSQDIIITWQICYTKDAEIERYNPKSQYNKIHNLNNGEEVYVDNILDMIGLRQDPIIDGITIDLSSLVEDLNKTGISIDLDSLMF